MMIKVPGMVEFQLVCDKCGCLDLSEEKEGYYCCNGQCDGFFSYYEIAELMMQELRTEYD